MHLVVITADKLNAGIHLFHFSCGNQIKIKDSILREYKRGHRKAIPRNSTLLGCLLLDSPIVSC